LTVQAGCTRKRHIIVKFKNTEVKGKSFKNFQCLYREQTVCCWRPRRWRMSR
jgi:hypothetical protein